VRRTVPFMAQAVKQVSVCVCVLSLLACICAEMCLACSCARARVVKQHLVKCASPAVWHKCFVFRLPVFFGRSNEFASSATCSSCLCHPQCWIQMQLVLPRACDRVMTSSDKGVRLKPALTHIHTHAHARPPTHAHACTFTRIQTHTQKRTVGLPRLGCQGHPQPA
jgi:hypothetical protein